MRDDGESAPLLAPAATPKRSRHHAAYVLSAASCLLSASFTVFSLYTDTFEARLGYTPLELNYVSIAAEAGLYLFVPVLGYIADASRLSSLGIIGSLTYALGYAGCAWVLMTHQPYQWMMLFFAIVGIGCSAVFISSLVNCARLYPKSALLAISLPTTLYGCSSLLYAQVVSQCLKHGVDLALLFGSLGALLFAVGLLAFAAPRIGDVDTMAGKTPEELEAPYLLESESYLRQFFRDHKTLIFLGSFILVSGPLEMYQNNIGLMVKAGHPGSNAAVQVGLFTGCSTVSRLVVGASTDIMRLRPPVVLLWVLGVLAVVDALFAGAKIPFWLTSSVSGAGYGSSFTLYPLIVSQVWGIERLATYWGMFILGPAIGSFIFGVLFASNMQGSSNYSLTFSLCSIAVVVSCVTIYKLRFQDKF